MTKHLALLVVPFLCFAEKASTQENLLARFVGSYEVLRSTLPAPDAEIIIRAVSEGRGLHSTWRHGEGTSYYEAHALWGYDPISSLVTVLEVNTLGVVAIHRGQFDGSGSLTVERLDEDTTAVLERRRFWWSDHDTLEMTLDILSAQPPIHHEVTLVRR